MDLQVLRRNFTGAALGALALSFPLATSTQAVGAPDLTSIPLKPKEDLDTYYTTVCIAGGCEEYLVDTGAGYMTITEETLSRAQRAGKARYVAPLEGILADGSVLKVPVYQVDITLENHCRHKEVEVAVLPGASRGLYGLTAMKKGAVNVDIASETLKVGRCDEWDLPPPAA